MGNTHSAAHFDEQLANHKSTEAFIVGEADEANDLGPIWRSNHAGTDPNVPLMTGIRYNHDDPNSEVAISLWDVVFKMGKAAAGADEKCLGMRAFKVAETPYEHSEAKLAKLGPRYVPTGYVERSDGNPERYEYRSISYQQTEDFSSQWITGLVKKFGAKPFESRVGVFMPNRPEYYLTAFGCWSQGIPIVPLYTTLGPDAVYTILEQTQCEFLVLSKENLSTAMKAFAKLKADKKSVGVKTVFVCDALFDNLWGNVFDTIDEKLAAECQQEYDITVCPFSAAAVAGQEATELIQPSDEIKPETQAYIMFTSGTTSDNGKIKGVILTHGGFASCIGASRYTIPLSTFPGQPAMSFLPLSHVFQVCIDLACLSSGANLIFGSGIIYLPTDLTEGQPKCLPAVPRIAQRFFSGVFEKIGQENFLKRWYINRAYAYQCNQLDNNLPLDPTYDERVFKVIRTKMGLGNLHIFIVSGAPCPPTVLQFMRVLLGPKNTTILGYGLTESHAGLSSSLPFDTLPHHIGTPIVSAEWRLKSLPDMNYSYNDENPCGELLLRGNSITPGYFQNDEENEKNFEFDSQGSRWYKTGDVVKMHKNSGLLQIIDRRKNCIKLSFGEYVGIEKLVSVYSQCALLSQVFPYGNAFKNSMVAVVVPNLIELYKFAKSKGWWNIPNSPIIGSLSPEVIAEAGRIGEEYQTQLVAWIKPALVPYEAPLNSFEKIKAFYVDTHYTDDLGLVFSENNGLLTPTMKLKLKPLAMHYYPKLEELYVSLGEPTSEGQPWW